MTESHDVSYFKSIAWCSSLISSPNYTIAVTRSREPKDTTEDALFAETLKTGTTISACLSLYKNPVGQVQPIEETRRLLALGSGLNGWPNICHGGITATILDEVMAHLLTLRMDREDEILRAAGKTPRQRLSSFTGELTVKYLRPIATPQTVCVVARVQRSEGRKVWLEGVVEDQFGTPLSTGTSLYIAVRPPKL
jgi:acyl-coenzyme A thioesterase PaaI-like protein